MTARHISKAQQDRQADRELMLFQRALDASDPDMPEDAPLLDLIPNYWSKRRRPPRPTDRALAGPTLDWLMTLPKEIVPHALLDKYPRVANTIAAAWPDPDAAKACFDSLLFDKRPNRKGFPSDVRRDLKILRFHWVTAVAPAPKP